MDTKRILVIYYTQTGQQLEILEHLLGPIRQDNKVEISMYGIQPEKDYPFPWEMDSFLDVFPESFLQIPIELKPIPESILNTEFDLVILSYQAWFLTPSIPINSFLKGKDATKLLAGKPVITLVSCRNMWFMAQEKVKKELVRLNANLVGHIALVDRNWNHVSLVTILHWVMKGRKDSYLGIFPKPGVSTRDIQQSSRFAGPILRHLKLGKYDNLQKDLLALDAVMIRPLLVFIDKRGNFMFSKWAAAIRKKGLPGENSRKKWLKLFYYYLSFALWVVAPIVSILYYVFYLPFLPMIRKEVSYFKSVKLK